MKKKRIGNLIIKINKDNESTFMDWTGHSNDINPAEKLVPFFDDLIDEVKGNLEITFLNLNFMNSSTIYPLIMFIRKLNEKKIKTIIKYDKNSGWQRTSFKAMETLAKVLENIRVIGI